MARHAAVRIDDDLAAGQSGIGHRSADLESAAWIDEKRRLVVQEVVGDDLPNHRLDDRPLDLVVRDIGKMLR
jgi:hypothetical protein